MHFYPEQQSDHDQLQQPAQTAVSGLLHLHC